VAGCWAEAPVASPCPQPATATEPAISIRAETAPRVLVFTITLQRGLPTAVSGATKALEGV